MKKNEDYNIGLDIGTTSVGWAVTDLNNNILKKNSKNMWGVRLFEEGKTAEERRKFRSDRRRLNRRKERITLLQNLLEDEINKVDSEFYLKLKESSIVSEDKKVEGKGQDKKYNIFKELEMNDSKFFEKYPTIYHLRKELIKKDEKKDIRLIYLAIHHILKYRGNFLYEGQEFSDQISSIKENIEKVLKFLQTKNIYFQKNNEDIIDILKDNNTNRKEKINKITECFSFDKDSNKTLKNIISAILGYEFEIDKIFDLEEDKDKKISFSEDIELNEFEESLGEDYDMFENLHLIYSWYILQEILDGKDFISIAFKKKYDKYAEDLKKLKKVYKSLGSDIYNEMFRKDNGKNYKAYNEKSSLYSKEELYIKIKEKLEKEEKSKEIVEILSEIENKTFLCKINTTDNSAIPYQKHYKELEKILNNQEKYYDGIKKNKEKILQIMKFKIPYYVGPLNNKSKFSWVVKNSDEKIYPWNFDNIVNKEESAEKFIYKMTNTCTYLYNEPVMPKNSLLYLEYCVLNELNNIRINDKKISKETKKDIIEKLFKTHKKVTVKAFKSFLIENQYYKEIHRITGLANESQFMTSMTSFIDMTNIFEKIDESNRREIEKIIEWITLFEDKEILKMRIKGKCKFVTEVQLKRLLKLKYKGWSRLSRKLLNEIKSNDNETIMDKLRKTNYNFMQIINKDEYGFNKIIEKSLPNLKKEKITYQDVEIIPGSPALKKSIWQVIQIVDEIVKIKGYHPKNIYIEFARGEEKNKKRKDTRILRLNKIYQSIEQDVENFKKYNPEVYKELKNKSKEKEFSEKLYLYFIQNGRSLYSEKSLDIDTLTEKCEIDHILPQSYIKDNSISNKALVLKGENQRKKDDLLLDFEIIKKQREWWNQLYKNGLIDTKKYFNLIRTSISDDEKVKFINRQLVETRQITKYVTNLLVNTYTKTNIFSLNSNITTNFRCKYNFYKNRNINAYHHAQDAYIVSVVGNFIDKNFKNEKNEYIYTQYIKDYMRSDTFKKRENEDGIVLGIFDNELKETNMKEKIEKIMNYKDCFITKKLEEQTGEFYDQTLHGKEKNPKIRIKKNLETEKYGGYKGEEKAYYSIIQYENAKEKEEIEMVGVPIQISYLIRNKQKTLEEHFKEVGYKNCKILKEKILKYQSYYNEYNERMILVSDTEICMNKQLLISNEYQKLIYFMNSNDEKQKKEAEEQLTNIFDYLLEKMKKEYKTLRNQYEKILQKRDEFLKLNFEDARKTINEIIALMNKGKGKLSSIGLSNELGRMNGKTFKKDKLIEMKFINESITGMYKEIIDFQNF